MPIIYTRVRYFKVQIKTINKLNDIEAVLVVYVLYKKHKKRIENNIKCRYWVHSLKFQKTSRR